ncbi:MAG: phytoene desaturase family protein [Candidatus Neomarinimicrobiota bacterium]
MGRYDIIIIGSGVNSLVAAAILARKGKKILILEARKTIGGLASTIEFAPGFNSNIIHDAIKWLDPRVLKELEIESNGLELIDIDIKRIALGPNKKEHILFHKDPIATSESISKYSNLDAEKWIRFTEYVDRLTKFLEQLYQLTPPELPNIKFMDALSMRSLLNPIFKQGFQGLVDLARTAPMMMPEFMDEWFENELLRSALAAAGTSGLSYGPYAAATGYNFLHQHLYSKGIIHNAHVVKGGTGNIPETLKQILESYDVELRTNAKVTSINIKKNIYESVSIDNGEIITSDQVISGLDPNNTFINLIGAQNLNPNFHTQIKNIKYRGSTARVHFGFKEMPEIEGINEQQMNTIFSFCPSMEYMERASDAVKYGSISNNPYVEFSIPTIINPEFSLEGKHIISATVQYAPFHLRNCEWNSATKEQLCQNTIKVLEKKIPQFSKLIETTAVYTPKDLENEFGLTEGNINHGEMTLDQILFMRPTASSSQYSTPFENLYLCGSGTHPGGGIHGMNGYNAAKKVLEN